MLPVTDVRCKTQPCISAVLRPHHQHRHVDRLTIWMSMSCTVVQICFTIARPGATMIGVHHDDVYCPSSLSRNKLVDLVEKAAL